MKNALALAALSHATFAAMHASGFHFPLEGVSAPPAPSVKPEPVTVEKLREEHNRLYTEGKGVAEKAFSENRALNETEKTDNEKRFKRLKEIAAMLDEEARFAAMALSGDGGAGSTVITAKVDPPGRDAYETSRDNDTTLTDDPDPTPAEKRAYAKEINAYAKTGELGPMAKKFATITTTTGSGILLPRSITAPAVPTTANVFREAHAANGVSPIETPGTGAMKMPVLDANAGGVVAENTTTLTENGAMTESIDLTPKTYESGSIWFSNLVVNANTFDVLQTCVPSLTYNKELGLESAIAAALIADSAVTQSVLTATTSGLTYANLVDLSQRLPKRYQRQQAIVLSADAYAAAIKLVGSDGHPVLIADPQTQTLMRFAGIPVMRCDYLEAFGLTKVVGVVFSLLGFKLRDVTTQNLARYVNFPGRPDQVGLDLFAYHAYGWAPSAVAKLKTPAS